MIRKIFEPKRNDVRENCRILRNRNFVDYVGYQALKEEEEKNV